MAKDFKRTDRVGPQIQRDLAELIRGQLQHAKSALITITDVEVTRDYSFAKVFYTYLGSEADRPEIQHALEDAKGFLRSELARGLKLYKMPALLFHYDVSVENGMRLDGLIIAANRTHSDSE